MIAFSQPVRLGDYISVDDVYGTVEEIRFTYTYIRTPDDRRVVIPNEAFASQVVNNFSMGSSGSMVAVDFVVPMASDVDAVRAAVLTIADELRDGARGQEQQRHRRGAGRHRRHPSPARLGARPLRRGATLASDLRAAILRRLRDDGVLGAAREASGAAD